MSSHSAVSRALAAAILCAASASGARVPGSPFPVVGAPNASAGAPLLVFDNNGGGSADDAMTMATLAGVLSRAGVPKMYRLDGADTSLWLNATAALFGVQPDAATCPAGAGAAACLLRHFAAQLTGYVLVDANSTNLGVMAGVARRAVSVSAANEATAQAAGLPLLYDLRGRDLVWALAEFGGAGVFSARVSVLQDPSKTKCMSDFAIATGALQWWTADAESVEALLVLASLAPPFAVLGWGPDEFRTVRAVSRAGGAVVASDWASNLDLHSSFDLPQFVQQQRRLPPPPPPRAAAAAVHTVAFLMSDGDNVQFLLNSFATGAAWWASPARGQVPMGWTISPSLVDLAPVVAKYIYDSASPQDDLVAGVSGWGYAYPDTQTAPRAAAAATRTGADMHKADMRLVNVLGAGEGYAAATVEPLLAQAEVDAVLWYNCEEASN